MFKGIEDMPGADRPIPNSDRSYPTITLTYCIHEAIFFHSIGSPEGPVVIHDG
jgi:hypothetical protein